MAPLADEYVAGASLHDLSRKHGIPVPTIRNRLAKLGVLRSRADGVRLAAAHGKLGKSGPRGPWSPEVRVKMSQGRKRWADENAVGLSFKASGYVEYTRGEHKGRSVHVVLMEGRIGRHILPDEVVHHIDGNRTNNNINNLALMTREAHARLHRFEDCLANNIRERDANGRFS